MVVVSFRALITMAGLVVVLVVEIGFRVVLAAEVKFIFTPTTLAIVVLFTMTSFLISGGVELETSICLVACGFEVVLKIFTSACELFVALVVAAVDVDDDDVASVDETVIKVNVVALAFFEGGF